MYASILQPGGLIHLKTDSPELYRFTLKVIKKYNCVLHENNPDIYASGNLSPELVIRTHYEALDIAGSKRVHYICFSLPATLPSKELDITLQEELKNEAVG